MHDFVRLLDLSDAMLSWTGKPLAAFPNAAAPVGYLEGVAADEENRVLARSFRELCPLHEAALAEVGEQMIQQATRRSS